MLTKTQRKLVMAALLTGAAALPGATTVHATSCCIPAYMECDNICSSHGGAAQCDMDDTSWPVDVSCHCQDLTFHQFYYVC